MLCRLAWGTTVTAKFTRRGADLAISTEWTGKSHRENVSNTKGMFHVGNSVGEVVLGRRGGNLEVLYIHSGTGYSRCSRLWCHSIGLKADDEHRVESLVMEDSVEVVVGLRRGEL
jgi:hypothetical protein